MNWCDSVSPRITTSAVELSDVDEFVPEVTGDAGESARVREEARGEDDGDEGDAPEFEFTPVARAPRESGAEAAARSEVREPSEAETAGAPRGWE